MRYRVIDSWLMAFVLCLASTIAAATVAPVSSNELAKKTYDAQELLDEYYGDSRNIVRAQQYLNEVLTQNPDFVPAHIQAARLVLMGGYIRGYEFEDGTLEMARTIVMRAKKLEPGNAEVYVMLGHLHFLEENDAAALDALNTARDLKSSNPWLNDNFGDIYLRQRDWAKADEHFKLVEALGAGSTPQQRKALTHALTMRQQIASRRNDVTEVRRLGRLATHEAAPQDAWTWGEVANVLFVEGFFDESIRDSRKALSIMSYGVGRQNLALGLYGKWAELTAAGNAAAAEPYFTEAYALLPDLDYVHERFEGGAEKLVNLRWVVEKRASDLYGPE